MNRFKIFYLLMFSYYLISKIINQGTYTHMIYYQHKFYRKPSMKTKPSKTVQQDLMRLSLINNLKQKIEQLKQQVQSQKATIEGYKKSTKTTLINEQQIQIQKLNDQNKRLLLIIEDMKMQFVQPAVKPIKGNKNSRMRVSVMNYSANNKKKDATGDEQQQVSEEADSKHSKKQNGSGKRINYEQKYYEILMENDKIRKELILLKSTESQPKNKRPPNDRSNSILIENSINQMDKVHQKNYELEAELSNTVSKNSQLKQRVGELEEMLDRAMQINKSMKII